MNFTKLSYVVAVDRAGSVSVAAKGLNISQSAVTKAVADIESELGFALFDRKAHGVVTTPAGRDFVDRTARILSDVDQLAMDAKEGRKTKDLLLRVGVTPGSLEGLMNRCVEALLLADSDVRLHMRASNFETGIMLFRQGDIDALVGPKLALDAEPGVVSRELPPMRPFVYARKTHPLVGRNDLLPQDIAMFPIIVPDIQGPLVSPLLTVLEFLGGNPLRRVHVIETYPITARLIDQSDAIGVVLGNFADSHEFSSRFSILDFDMGGALPMAVATRKSQPMGKALQRFLGKLELFPPTG